MPLALAALLTASAALPATLPTCSWNRPGHNPFMGDVVAAVDRYPDIPAPVRARLKERMASRSYDEVVSIRRDAIVGKARYRPEIRDMHFGTGQVCGTVNRMQWQADTQERGLVYCEAGHCILVPTVCRNVSRISRENAAVAGVGAAAPVDGGGGGGGTVGGGDGGTGGGMAGGVQSLGAGTASAAAAAGAAGAAVGQEAAGGQEAAAPTSFVAGLHGSESAGSGGPWAGGTTLAGGAAGLAGGGSSWLAAAAGTPWVGEVATAAPAAAPWRAAGGSDGSGVPLFYSGSGLQRPVRGVTGNNGLTEGGIPGDRGTGIVLPPPPVIAVPEPGTWALMLAGLAVLVRRARRRA